MTDTVQAAAATPSPLAPATLRTFLLADVRGFTRFTADRGDAAAATLSELFLGLCREVVSARGGEVFGSAGDEALAAFASAGSALQAALALQARLAEVQSARPDLPLRVGIGLDAGESIQVGSDYRGHPINRAARLCSIAGPGEIFASEVVISLARLTDGMAVVDRGEVTLKGLAHPVRVIQVGPEGALPAHLPPLQPILVTHPTNLPDEPTPFIGRAADITAIRGMLGDPRKRLVTLTGPGGTGKTRLALQVGMSLLYAFRDGVFFCDLSPLSDPAHVLSAIGQTLGVQEAGNAGLLHALTEHLKERHLLLVLDNCEQVIDAAPVVGALLDACRELKVLATSRVPLHLTREREYAVSPLAVPDPSHLPPLERLSQYEAVALFIDRAQAVKHGFAITNENAPAVAEICHRLDGLPLAIELAAARVKLFPPAALLHRLQRSLGLLTGGARDGPSRHQTLRAAIDWSYSLLSEEEQRLFARLSVFSGGCSFDIAEEVCNPDGDLELLDGMTSLVEESLIRQEGEEEPRFRMLETIREYAAEKLRDEGEDARIRDGHATLFLALAEEAEGAIEGPGQRDWLLRLDRELDNLYGAMRWLLEQGRADEQLRLATALYRFWEIRGRWREGQGWMEEGLATSDDRNPALQAKTLCLGSALLFWQGVYDQSVAWLERGLEQADRAGDHARRASILSNLGSVHSALQRYEQAAACYEEALQLARELGLRTQEASLVNNLGVLAHNRGDWATAKQRYRQALALFRTIGVISQPIVTQFNLGLIAQHEGNLDEAQTWYTAALEAARELGDEGRIVLALKGLGEVAVAAGRHEEAERLTHESLTLARELGAKRDVSDALVTLGQIALQMGRLEEARDRLNEGLRLARDLENMLTELIGLASMASLAEAEGREEAATRLKAAELAARTKQHLDPDALAARAGEDLCAHLRTALGDERYAQAWAMGEQMGLDEALDFALEEQV